MMAKNIHVYTDGSCYNRKGYPTSKIGGIGIVIIDEDGSPIEISEGPFPSTTSARMEIMAIIRTLETIPKGDEKIIIHTDNEYCSKALNDGWVFNWEENGFFNRANADLWKRFLKAYRNHNENVQLVWIKGHSDDEWNDLADSLADKGRCIEN